MRYKDQVDTFPSTKTPKPNPTTAEPCMICDRIALFGFYIKRSGIITETWLAVFYVDRVNQVFN